MPFPRSLLPALLALAFPLPAQIDAPALRQRVTAAEAEVQQSLQRCQQALDVVRAAIGDPENKVQGSCTEIGNVLAGGSFDGGLGVVPIAIEHLEYVAEDRRAATLAALTALRSQLAAGSRALQALEALQELAGRMESLAALAAEDDATWALADLAASAGKATRSGALARADLALLQQQLAKRRAANEGRIGRELAGQAKAELAQLRADLPALRAEMGSADAGERDRGFARFDEAARSIRTALARVPAAERKAPAAELDELAKTADELFGKGYGQATAARIQENWAFTADQFDGWRDETPAITARGYLDFEPAGVEVLCAPKTVALVGRANAWLAFVGQDAEYRRNQRHAEVAAFTAGVLAQRDTALAKLLPLAQAVVDGLPAIEITEERLRNRLQVLADWDLPLALQLHPELPGLRARVHALLDAHDRRVLGDDKALATIREQALAAAEALWPRLQAWLPVEGGFEPATSWLFTGRLMRLEGVWLRTDEFAPGSHDLVFDLGGQVFAGTLGKGLAAHLHAARQRLGLLEASLPADAPCELLAVVGADTELSLLGAKGKDDAIAVPARALQIVGLRQGAVFAVAP